MTLRTTISASGLYSGAKRKSSRVMSRITIGCLPAASSRSRSWATSLGSVLEAQARSLSEVALLLADAPKRSNALARFIQQVWTIAGRKVVEFLRAVHPAVGELDAVVPKSIELIALLVVELGEALLVARKEHCHALRRPFVEPVAP